MRECLTPFAVQTPPRLYSTFEYTRGPKRIYMSCIQAVQRNILREIATLAHSYTHYSYTTSAVWPGSPIVPAANYVSQPVDPSCRAQQAGVAGSPR